MIVLSNRNNVVSHRLTALYNQIRLNIRMLRKRYLITLARKNSD